MLLYNAIKSYAQKIIIALENTSKQKAQSLLCISTDKHPFCNMTVKYTMKLTSDLKRFKDRKPKLSGLHKQLNCNKKGFLKNLKIHAA